MGCDSPFSAAEYAKPVPCTTPGCPGDGNYIAPGRGHLAGCRYPRGFAPKPTDSSS